MSAVPGPVADIAGLDLRPDPLQAGTPAEFIDALRRFRIWAGKPSFRELKERSGGELATATISVMLRGQALPSFRRMLAFVSACGGGEEDRQRFATAWRRLSLARDADGPGMLQIPAPRHATGRLPDRQAR